MNKITKRRIQCIAVIIGVIVLPLLYSYFYLGAFWDPYSRLDSLPVAVVNNDAGAMINGEKRNVGQELCDKLSSEAQLKFVFTDEATAKKGTEGKDYYAMIVIPSDFTSDIASAATTDKQTATLTFSSNEQRNFLASQILTSAVTRIELAVRENVTAEIVNQLADKLEGVPDQMKELQNGLGQLSAGANTLSTGTQALTDGTATYNANFSTLATGITSAKNGSAQISGGVASLDSGLAELIAGADQIINADTGKLTSGAQTLADNTKVLAAKVQYLSDNVATYTTGVDTLISNVNKTTYAFNTFTVAKPGYEQYYNATLASLNSAETAASVKLLSDSSANLRAGAAALATGAQQLSDGAALLPEGTAAGIAKIKAAVVQLQGGMVKAKTGADQLNTGSQDLYAGLTKADSGAQQLYAAAGTISSGAAAVDSGADQLAAGLSTAKSGVDSSVTGTVSQLAALDGIGQQAAAPVTINTASITSVPNYGTAFAPYFMSLSLFVGGLMIFVGIYYDPQDKFNLLSRNAENKVVRSFIYLLIGFVQAVVLGTILRAFLGLKVDNIPLYYLSCALVSCVFIAIIQLLMVYLKDLGKFVTMVLLILQLTSCGGTFPMELVPKMFNKLYAFMPMTYSVGLFKQSISGVKSREVLYNGGILLAILVVVMTITVMLSAVKSKRAERADDLQEVIA